MDPEIFMQRCFALASLGAGYVSPNPMVGAVLVHDGRIFGEGYHKEYGGPHAEVNCVHSVSEEDKNLVSSSTMYVSLEPCNHTGKTGPCTEFIIKNKIPKVVICCADSYAKMNGSGIARLREAGVEVNSGVLEREGRELNKRFFTFHEKQRPYIILKWAQSANGFIGTKGERTIISNELTDMQVHAWRAEEAAILVGTTTALEDNPSLTVRHVPGKNPIRIAIDLDLKIPPGHAILDKAAPTIIINTHKSGDEGNIFYYPVAANENMVAVIISLLHQRNLISLIVEGGAKILQHFIDAGIWDETRVITSSATVFAEGISAPSLTQATIYKRTQVKEDDITWYKNARPQA